MKKLLLLFLLIYSTAYATNEGYDINIYTGQMDNVGGWKQRGNDTWKVDNGNVGIGNTSPFALLAVGTYPTQGLYVTANGNVGVGTTNPTSRFVVLTPNFGEGVMVRETDNGGPSIAMQAASNYGFVTVYNSGATSTGIRLMGSTASPSWFNVPGGNLGVGTSDVTAKLTVRGNTANTAAFALRIQDSTPTDRLVVQDDGNVGIGTTAPVGTLHVGSQSVPPLFVSAAGNVGIGTTVPNSHLDVGGAPGANSIPSRVAIAGTKTFPLAGIPDDQLIIYDNSAMAVGVGGALSFSGNYQTGGTPVAIFGSIQGVKESVTSGNYAGQLQFMTRVNGGNDTVKMVIDSQGNVGIGNTAPMNLLIIGTSPEAPVLSVSKSGAVGIGITATTGLLQIGTSPGQGLIFVNAAGNVGIGTTNPLARCYINGDITVSSSVLAPYYYVTSGSVSLSGEKSIKLGLDWNSNDADTQHLTIARNTSPAGNPSAPNYLLRVLESGKVSLGIGFTDPIAKLDIRGDSVGGSELCLRIQDSTPTDRLVVQDDGNVGIGTTAPTALTVIQSPTGTAPGTMLYLRPSGTTVANRVGIVMQNESGVCYQLVIQGATPTAQACACP